jgi:DNA-binding FadR family transcriptional regulator
MQLNSNFIAYVVENRVQPDEKLPSLQDISKEIGISVGKLREQLEVARALGIVSVRPRRGTVRLPYDFAPAVQASLSFGLEIEEVTFNQFNQLRRAIETQFWDESVQLLTDEDKADLKEIVRNAWIRLNGTPRHIPTREHRQFHLKIFSRLDNPFVQGLLNAYWAAYEDSQITRLMGYEYWVQVWQYHERITDALVNNQFVEGRNLLIEHFDLLPEGLLPEGTLPDNLAQNGR